MNVIKPPETTKGKYVKKGSFVNANVFSANEMKQIFYKLCILFDVKKMTVIKPPETTKGKYVKKGSFVNANVFSANEMKQIFTSCVSFSMLKK